VNRERKRKRKGDRGKKREREREREVEDGKQTRTGDRGEKPKSRITEHLLFFCSSTNRYVVFEQARFHFAAALQRARRHFPGARQEVDRHLPDEERLAAPRRARLHAEGARVVDVAVHGAAGHPAASPRVVVDHFVA
jgi:hypothetical protein